MQAAAAAARSAAEPAPRIDPKVDQEQAAPRYDFERVRE